MFKVSPDRELHQESEQSAENEVSIVALLSMNLRILGSTPWQGHGVEVGHLGGEARAIAST
jgi:hypothetical protein